MHLWMQMQNTSNNVTRSRLRNINDSKMKLVDPAMNLNNPNYFLPFSASMQP